MRLPHRRLLTFSIYHLPFSIAANAQRARAALNQIGNRPSAAAGEHIRIGAARAGEEPVLRSRAGQRVFSAVVKDRRARAAAQKNRAVESAAAAQERDAICEPVTRTPLSAERQK